MPRTVCLPLLFAAALSAAVSQPNVAAEWHAAAGPLTTRWAKDVSPENARPEYPRPQLRRKDQGLGGWKSLNGLWDYAIRPKDEGPPRQWDGKILVPFPVESALSGVMKRVGPDHRLWYRLNLPPIPNPWENIKLHFGAADWETQVWFNGKELGRHRGGYDPFSFDLPNLPGPYELIVSCWDPSDAGNQPRGKQVNKPGGIFYTPVTGIWQTVWLENPPRQHIRDLKITPDVARSQVRIAVDATEIRPADTVAIEISGDGWKTDIEEEGKTEFTVNIPKPRLWSPDDPFLYDIKVTLVGREIDSVESYFAMRSIAVGKDADGVPRLLLNGKPLFQFGPLDQGYWPDGLYTAPTQEAMVYDLEVTRKLGFNMIRKHVKVEPATWYHECDKRGILVWQDMPSGDRGIGPNDADFKRSPESAMQFEAEWKNIIAANRHFPSIVMWVPFNEGWGQYDTARIVDLTRQLDPTRLVNCASGWTDRGVGDVHDMHNYPGPAMFRIESQRASVLGEFGGLGLPIEGHTWQAKNNWGYKSFASRPELTAAYLQLIRRLRPLIGNGLAAAVYTQTTDVEVEVNGLMTYDRAEIKVPVEEVARAHSKLYLPPPKTTVLVPTAQQAAHEWRYTTSKPSDNWHLAHFDDASWQKGEGGLGTSNTPGTSVRTEWNTPEIWARREFELAAVPRGETQLLVHHDEDATIYINGVLATRLPGYTTDYVPIEISAEARDALKAGRNVIAVECRQTGGGQYIDVGLVEVSDEAR